jgi:bla regulator protein BlaR1
MAHGKLAAAYLALILSANSQTSPPTFEIASVKPSPSGPSGAEFNFAAGGGLAVRNADLKGIIQMAFDSQAFQIAGAPGWTTSARYDIFAKSADARPGASPDELRQDARRKLQTLLADRFQLLFHRETRQVNIYHLTIAKDGPKFAGAHDSGPNGGINGRCGQYVGTKSSIGSLVYMLSRELGSPIDDRTGLTGRYDFKLEYAPTGTCQQVADNGDRPSVFSALQDQIGLKLESAKGPVEIIVIDRIERPTGN